MPGFVYIANTVKIEINQYDIHTLQPIVNVLHGSMTDGVQDEANVFNVSNALVAAINTSPYLDAVTNDTAFFSVTTTGLATDVAPQSTVFFPSAVYGLGDSGPSGVAALVKLTTAYRSRSGRGRIYAPMVPSDALTTGNQLDSTQMGRVTTAIGVIETALGGLDPVCNLVVASRALGLSHPVTDFACEALVAYQRRRGGR